MKTFVWTVCLATAIEVVAKIIVLASGNMPVRRPAAVAMDAVVGAAVVIWAAVLLAQA